jgi:RNA polymerase sigma factor (sigma-70 family)
MMALVHVPPFESFYVEHRDAVLRELRRTLGRERAEDAYQETFLRALRAYGRLRNADNLRAWVLTIARRVAVDQLRRREASPPAPEPATDSRPAYAELGELADDLPRKERAAVVLRYGYDLSYAAIGAALGSSEDAARQATSAGVRRLRRRMQ